jgi:ABC-2 type transport system ATP-binding protein
MPNTIIEVKNLKKSYKTAPQPNNNNSTDFEAVRGVTFEVNQGEIFGLLGPNGAGKSTTLEMIEGLKKSTTGTISVLGIDAVKNPDKVKELIGVQLQTAEYMDYLTLVELIDLFASMYDKKVDARGLLEFIGMSAKADEFVKNLSGGQKQRFTLGTALVNDPKLLFLDEPTTGLDPRVRRDIWELISHINKEKGVTVVMTTHYMEEAEFLCHRVAVMDQGKILAINEPQKLIEDIAHTTKVSFFTNQKIDESIWKTIPAIEKVYSNYPKVILELLSLDEITAVINLLKQKNIRFSGFTVKTASLEDVYLDLTGKDYED